MLFLFHRVLTPYYQEDVLFSIFGLEQQNEDGVSILFYLQKIFPGFTFPSVFKWSCDTITVFWSFVLWTESVVYLRWVDKLFGTSWLWQRGRTQSERRFGRGASSVGIIQRPNTDQNWYAVFPLSVSTFSSHELCFTFELLDTFLLYGSYLIFFISIN